MYKGPLSQAKLCGRNNNRFYTYSWDSSVEAVSRLGCTSMRNLTQVCRKVPIAFGFVDWRFRTLPKLGSCWTPPPNPLPPFPSQTKHERFAVMLETIYESIWGVGRLGGWDRERPRANKTDKALMFMSRSTSTSTSTLANVVFAILAQVPVPGYWYAYQYLYQY